jgi:hypothetical protein
MAVARLFYLFFAAIISVYPLALLNDVVFCVAFHEILHNYHQRELAIPLCKHGIC